MFRSAWTQRWRHPIWEATTREWLAAAQLEEGHVLLGEDGLVPVTGVEIAVEWQTVHNLSVHDIHTFSVSNGVDEIVTHNCGDSEPLALFDGSKFDLAGPSSVQPLGRGSTGRTRPNSVNEQLSMSTVRSAPWGARSPDS